jgi:transposase
MGVVVARVPWAHHGAGHTRGFDDQVARLVTHTSKTAVVELIRIAWRTVGAIAGRVVAEARELSDPFDGLERIGIDEISSRRGHKYLMVVVDHDTGRLVWAKTKAAVPELRQIPAPHLPRRRQQTLARGSHRHEHPTSPSRVDRIGPTIGAAIGRPGRGVVSVPRRRR